MKIVVIADTHNRHRELTVPAGDVLVHAGDMTLGGAKEEVEEFNNYLGELPHRHKIVIAGNHDFCFEREPEPSAMLLSNAIYLQDETTTVDGIVFYGSPWQPRFFNFAFNLTRGPEIREKWDLIPENVDILVTHGPPRGYGDQLAYGEKVGCRDLLAAVERVKPRVHVFGHIHEGVGIYSNGHTTFINASCCDRAYEPVNRPVIVEIAP